MQGDVAEICDLLFEEEAFLELELDTGVSQQFMDVVDVVNVVLSVLAKDDDVIEVHQEGPPPNLYKMISRPR